jgi:type II secretory pathway predicted ATPase ExeA
MCSSPAHTGAADAGRGGARPAVAWDACARPFAVQIARCRACGREWPGWVAVCRECAAAVGEPRTVDYLRLAVNDTQAPLVPMFAVVVAVEVAWPAHAQRDPQALWQACVPLCDDALSVAAAERCTAIVAWPAERSQAVVHAAARTLELRARISDAEVRCGVALGVVGCGAGSEANRCAEQLALASAPGQTLMLAEVARRLGGRFEVGGGEPLPRWPIKLAANLRWLVGWRPAIRLPSALSGERPALVVGRAREQRQLREEFATVTRTGRRRVVLVTAPAGGGKSYLLRHLLGGGELRVAGGVAFAPLGERSLELVQALATSLGGEPCGEDASPDAVGTALARAATACARQTPSAVVVDDLHWAAPDALRALVHAIDASDAEVPLAWVLSARTAAIAALAELTAITDRVITLDPLSEAERVALLEARLEEVSDELHAHVARGAERGNPLYLEHLAATVGGHRARPLPATLHEAVLARLDDLARQADALTSWPAWAGDRRERLEALERELEDWLDRLETNDVAELATIGRYLGRLRGVDVTLVVARSLLGMPVRTSRRLAHTIERLSAASVDAHLAYLATLALDGHLSQAAAAARTAAEQAQRELRLGDAERMIAFACQQQPHDHALLRSHGDVALALGRPLDAVAHYHAAAQLTSTVELERRTARAQATAGQLDAAIERLERAARHAGELDVAGAVTLDLARLRGEIAPSVDGALARQWLRARAWAQPGAPQCRDAVAALTLDGPPLANAAELVETAALARVGEVSVAGLAALASQAAIALRNPLAVAMLTNADPAFAGKLFLHWRT